MVVRHFGKGHASSRSTTRRYDDPVKRWGRSRFGWGIHCSSTLHPFKVLFDCFGMFWEHRNDLQKQFWDYIFSHVSGPFHNHTVGSPGWAFRLLRPRLAKPPLPWWNFRRLTGWDGRFGFGGSTFDFCNLLVFQTCIVYFFEYSRATNIKKHTMEVR